MNDFRDGWNTAVAAADSGAISRACALLREGALVALPAETVYGLAGDALSPEAAGRIFEAKGRPSFNPLIVHVADASWLDHYADIPLELRDVTRKLAAAFWPGPLTMVLPKRPIIPGEVSAGLPTAAFRVPAHPVFQAVLKEFGRPLAAPSANRSGRISPTTAQHVWHELRGRIPLILDGGACARGLESTVIRPMVENGVLTLRILRPGPVTRGELERFGRVVESDGAESGPLESPGQMLSHYAPNAAVLVLPMAEIQRLCTAGSARNYAVLTLFPTADLRVGEPAGLVAVASLCSANGDLSEAASHLYARLRELDESGAEEILVEKPPEDGIGSALNDRLRRAAQPRDRLR